MSAASVADALCTFFGGDFDYTSRTYRTPQLSVPGVAMGVVRRGRPKRFDNNDFYLGQVGAPTGCMMYVLLNPGDEIREAYGGSLYGLKRVRHDVTMDVLIRSESAYAEDVQDAEYALRDAIVARIHADRTCGSGGIEAGGFQVGEGGTPGIRWVVGDPVSHAEKTEALLRCTFAADEYLIA